MATSNQNEPKSGNGTAPAKRQKAEKLTRAIQNPYDWTETYIVEGKSEADLENKSNAQFRKWDEEYDRFVEKQKQQAYISSGHEEARKRTAAEEARLQQLLNLKYTDLHITTEESFISENVNCNVKKKSAHKPRIEEYLANEKVNYFVKALHFLKSDLFADKYSAADRKYNEALEAYQKEQAEYDQEYETAYKQEQLRYTRIAAHMGAGLIDDVVAYFHYVLCADIFNLGGVPFKKGFKRSWFYYAKEKELSFYYRIPTLDDLSLVQCYTYDERGDLLVPHQYPKAELQKHALDIASSILLRAIAVVFKSDPYDVVRKIDLIGYLEYLDESCGQMKQKDVFRAVVNKEQFNELDLEYVNPKMFFERKAKAEYADGLYLSENIDLAGLEVSHRED